MNWVPLLAAAGRVSLRVQLAGNCPERQPLGVEGRDKRHQVAVSFLGGFHPRLRGGNHTDTSTGQPGTMEAVVPADIGKLLTSWLESITAMDEQARESLRKDLEGCRLPDWSAIP